MKYSMTPMERVLTTLGFQEPDRVPFFLLLSLHGARELGMSLKEYFSRGEYVAEAQLRMQKRYGHDCLYAFFYAAIETEAWGGHVVYREDGPPNAGAPIIHAPAEIDHLQAPPIESTPRLQEVLKAIRIMYDKAGDRIPIIAVVMSPFSLPVMQMGFDHYIDLMMERPESLDKLLRVNEGFCISLANAQLAAGATAICYFDPLASPSIIPREIYLKTGFQSACRVLSAIKGPVATHLASGRSLPVLEDLAATGTSVVGISSDEDLEVIKQACRGKLALLGNLNGVEMRRWTVEKIERVIKEAISKGGPGGGFILSDNHGEIPFQVPESVLDNISESVLRWGQYPLSWCRESL